MKTFFIFLFPVFCCFPLTAQDTIRKTIQYDISIGSASEITDPLFRNYINALTKSSPQTWLATVFEKASSGEIGVMGNDFGTYLSALWFQKNKKPIADTVYIIDPITLEEQIEVLELKEWGVKDVVAVRFYEKWKRNHSTNEWYREFVAFAPVFKMYTTDGQPRDERTFFWVKIGPIWR